MRKFVLTCGALIAVLGGVTHAQDNTPSGFDDCAVKENSTERLACYDAIAKKQKPSETNTGEDFGSWNLTTEKSKIDDSTNVGLDLRSTDAFKDRWGKNNFVTFGISCIDHTTNVYFYFDGEFMSDSNGYGEITYRLGSAKAVTMQATPSTNNKALGLWGGSGITFLKKVMTDNKLVVRASPYNDAPVTVEFDTTGLVNAIKPLRKACAW